MNATKMVLTSTMMFMLLTTAYALNPAEAEVSDKAKAKAAETKDKAKAKAAETKDKAKAKAAETKGKARTEAVQKIQRTIKSMIEFAEKLQHEAEIQGNSEAQTEIQTALDYIHSAGNNVTNGKLEEAVSDLREAKTHLQMASELLRQS
jgi:hypothetical protein